MADQSVIKEFLVSLGFTIDDNSERKFNNSLKGAVVQANLLADAITSMARLVVESVQRVAQSFDGLYWASQRTGASVQNIRALSYAVSQLGGTYEGARGAIEAFGQHLRSNPGYGSLLSSLGVKTSENGKMRDQVAILEDLGKVLSKKPYPIALQYANALGIDENTMRALMSGDLQKSIKEYDDLQKSLGFNNEKAAASAKEFMNSMREAQITIETVVAKIMTDLEPQLSKVMKEFSEWVAGHGPQIEQAIVEIGAVVKLLADDFVALVDDLKPVWEGFEHIAKAIGGDDGHGGLVRAIELLVGGVAMGKLVRLLASLGGGAAASGGGIMAGLWGLLADPSYPGELNTPEGRQKIKTADDNAWYNGLWGKTKSFLGLGGSPQKGVGVPSSGQNANALESYKFWRQKGLSHNAALGMIANEEGESGFDPHNIGDGGAAGGSFQWHKERRNQILAGTGIDVWNSNTSHSDMLRAAHWEMTQGPDAGARKAWEAFQNVQTPQQGAAVGVKYYERPLNQAGDAYNRGIMANRWAAKIPENTDFSVSPANSPANNNTNQSVSQTTNINVVGATDPTATANAIAGKQSTVNTTMQRNLQGAVR